jgi:acetyl-CoA acetyltransferase
MGVSETGRRRAVITGIADTPVGKVPDRTTTQLYADAAIAAAADAGVDLADVDGLISGNGRFDSFLYHGDMLAEYLGIAPAHASSVTTGGSTTAQVLMQAVSLVESARCDHVLVVMADKLATGVERGAVVESMATIGHPRYESPSGPMIPALYALLAQRYYWEYGIDPQDVAEVAVVDRYHASLTSTAQYRDPITAGDVLESRLIADPIHLLECAPVSDAGAAVMVSVDREGARHTPVRVLGMGEARRYEHVSQASSLTETGAVDSGKRAFATAGLSPSDVDVAYVYDAFAYIMCMQLEDLGFCAKGEGASFVASGNTRLGGSLPTNTHGGLLSHSHAGRPSSLLMVTEAVRQLRGDCGERQVAGAEVALVHTEGGILASHMTLLLGK